MSLFGAVDKSILKLDTNRMDSPTKSHHDFIDLTLDDNDDGAGVAENDAGDEDVEILWSRIAAQESTFEDDALLAQQLSIEWEKEHLTAQTPPALASSSGQVAVGLLMLNVSQSPSYPTPFSLVPVELPGFLQSPKKTRKYY